MTNSLLSDPNINMGFDEWIKFIFNHPVSDDIKSAWYNDATLVKFWDGWTVDKRGDKPKQIEYATQLFQQPELLLTAYSPEQINQGFWFLLSGQFGFSLFDLLWDTEIPLISRQQCILAMVRVFQVIFTQIPQQDSCYMWWDLLQSFREEKDRDMEQTIIEALSEMLRIPSRDCQQSALHGFGHLNHPAKRSLIESYVQRNYNIDDEMKEYAVAAIEGKVL